MNPMKNISEIKRRYDFIGSTGIYDTIVDTFLLGQDNPIRRKLINNCVINNNDRILDIGTGTGRNLPLLLDLVGESGEIIGIDISSGMLEKASKRINGHNNVLLINKDILNFCPKFEFDVIIATYVFSVIPFPVELGEWISFFSKPNTRVLILEARIPKSLPGWMKLIIKFEEWIAAANLSVDVCEILSRYNFIEKRRFNIFNYITGIEVQKSN